MDEIRDMLAFEKTKDQAGCDDVTCLAEIGGALGVDDLLTGRLSKIGDGHVMVLRRIDQSHAQTVSVFDKRLVAGDGEEFLAAVGPAIATTFAEQPLRPGATRGVADEVALRLHPPPLPQWSVYLAAGGTLAALAGGSVFGVLARAAKQDYDAYAADSTTQLVNGRTLADKRAAVQGNALKANVFLVSAGALLLTTGIMSLFTDWHGYAVAR